jgi:hypothetical protein
LRRQFLDKRARLGSNTRDGPLGPIIFVKDARRIGAANERSKAHEFGFYERTG